jgi:hypothetical protein
MWQPGAEYRGRKTRCQLDEPGQLRQDPTMLNGELMAPGQLGSGVGQYRGIGRRRRARSQCAGTLCWSQRISVIDRGCSRNGLV